MWDGPSFCGTALCKHTSDAEGEFPDRSHLQYLFTCSLQIWRRKAWEIRSHAVMSVRQRVDTQEAVLDEVLKLFLSCTITTRAGGQSISKVVSIPLFMTPGLVQHETGTIYVGHCPCLSTSVCLM